MMERHYFQMSKYHLESSQRENIGTQGVKELFFCEVSEIGAFRNGAVYSNDLVNLTSAFWLRCTAGKKLGINEVSSVMVR